MKKIPLTNTYKKAKVDNEDYPWLMQYEWEMDEDGYCVTYIDGERVEMGYMVVKNAEKHGRLRADGTIR